MKFNSITSRVTAVIALLSLFAVFCFFDLHFMENRQSIVPKAKLVKLPKHDYDTAISIVRLPAGFYKVKKILMSSLDEEGRKKIFVSIQSVNGLSKEQLLDSRGVTLEIYWSQPISDVKPDYRPGDVIERPRDKPHGAICHQGSALF